MKLCNPVLARISFLSTMFSPKIASIAAREALLKILENKVNEDDEVSDADYIKSADALMNVAVIAIKNAALNEEAEIERLSSSIAETRLIKCAIKLNQIEKLNEAARKEREVLDNARKNSSNELKMYAQAASKHRATIERYTVMEKNILSRMRAQHQNQE